MEKVPLSLAQRKLCADKNIDAKRLTAALLSDGTVALSDLSQYCINYYLLFGNDCTTLELCMDKDRNRPPKLFGTPLSKSLEDGGQLNADVGPINRRRARSERHQIVEDEQGRRRFHGAFTGGFSAGYYNTVDTVQGFQPKSFRSQRGADRQDGAASFDHRPEDYMDEEDFSEFGIAPKRIRLAGQFSEELTSTAAGRPRGGLPLVVKDSIGDRILRCMTRNRKADYFEASQPITPKNDYHGLGYRPLNAKHSTHITEEQSSQNPLVATLKSGMQLKIMGEAFGVGVLDDDEDSLHNTNEYGYDDIANYDFSQAKSSIRNNEHQPKSQKSPGPIDGDPFKLPGFILASGAMEPCDTECLKYPLPVIEDTWKMPVRTEPLIKQPDETDLNRLNIDLYKNRISSFNDKFTRSESGRSKLTSDIEARSGLVPYSDLKAFAKTDAPIETIKESRTEKGADIIRRVVDWRPCSLLCKHFNVENPYPDNKYCGVKPSDLRGQNASTSDRREVTIDTGPKKELAPIELRKSIFNVRFDELDEVADIDQDIDDEPQVIESGPDQNLAVSLDEMSPDLKVTQDESQRLHQDDIVSDVDVIVVDVPKKEPEVIVLSSSEGSKSGGSTPVNTSDNDDDTYGPPLPPSRQTLQSLDRHGSKHHQGDSHSSSSKTDKYLKRKRHKTHKPFKVKKSNKHKTNN